MLFTVQSSELMHPDSTGTALTNAHVPHATQTPAMSLSAPILQPSPVAQSLSPSSSTAAPLTTLQPSASTSTFTPDVHSPPASFAHGFDSAGAPSITHDMLQSLVPRKKGKGGRQPAMDPRLDPRIDAKKAKRIMANRQSAARSKLKQKVFMDGLRTKHTLLAYQREAVARELNQLSGRCMALEEDNLSMLTRIQALTEQYRIQHVLTTKLSEQRNRLAVATGSAAQPLPVALASAIPPMFGLPNSLDTSTPTPLTSHVPLPNLMGATIKAEQQDMATGAMAASTAMGSAMLGSGGLGFAPFSKPMDNPVQLGGMAAAQGALQQQPGMSNFNFNNASPWPTCLQPATATTLNLSTAPQVALRCA